MCQYWVDKCNELDRELEQAKVAIKQLLDERRNTAMTYEDAYHFVFKSGSRRFWEALKAVLDLGKTP